VSHSVWQGLGQRVRHFLASITLADLTKDAAKGIKERAEC
jgi:Rrf2 family iron-sulfur cluster assembly transcriptional regulator